jgi:hypothetical protein
LSIRACEYIDPRPPKPLYLPATYLSTRTRLPDLGPFDTTVAHKDETELLLICRQLFTQTLLPAVRKLSTMTDRDRTPLTPDTSPSPAAHRKVAKTKQDKKVPSFLESPCHPKPAISTCKKHPINKDYPVVDEHLGLYFRNSEEAMASMDHAQWVPKADDTIPKTDEEAREVVKQLVDAFKDLSQAKDTAKNAYRKRFASGDYNNWSIEACAWDILVSEVYQWS